MVVARVGQCLGLSGVIGEAAHPVCRVVHLEGVSAQLVKVDSPNASGCALEAQVHHLISQAQRLKDLGALVAGQGADTHLGHHLENADSHALDVVLDNLGAGHGGGQLLVMLQRKERIICQVGAHAISAVAHQGAELVHLPGLTALHKQADTGALLQLCQVVVHQARGQQRADGHAVGAKRPVTQHDEAEALVHGLLSLLGNAVQAGPQASGALGNSEGGVDDLGLPVLVLHLLDGLHLLQGEGGLVQIQAGGVLGGDLGDVALGAHKAAQGGHHRLTEGVDWGVGHLCKQLLEVFKRQLGPAAECGQGSIIAHGAQGLGSALGHGHHQQLQSLARVAKDLQGRQDALNCLFLDSRGLSAIAV
mmetsp:Transcript_30094/g.66683  ORF Transcript_30094/g.66683 Transcript_30094/m.66683 type:complete len:363 (+) Transcript_30094:4764-5852(+)